MNTETDLRIEEFRLPAGSMRGLKGELSIIDNGPIIEMLDGSLRDQTSPEARRFEGTLSFADVNAPPLFGVWKGTILHIDFPVIVMEPIEIDQIRPHAPGSLFYVDELDNMEVPGPNVADRGNYPAAAFRCYRPHFTMMVMEPWKLGFDEWDASVSTSLKVREV